MAIKGKTKRSQGRTVRRVTPGPRAVAVERRQRWYRAPAFAATLAIVAVLVTLVVAVDRVQFGWARDDVARFTDALTGPMSKVTGIAGSGADGQPGITSVAEFASGKVKADEVVKRSQTWQQQLTTVREQVNGITVGEVATGDSDGTPSNQVGGRVGELSAIRDAYLTGIGYYDEAARAWQQAGEAIVAVEAKTAKQKDDAATQAANTLRDQLIQSAQSFAQKGQQALDVAAVLLAHTRARFDLNLAVRMPGESASSFGARYIDPAGPTPSGEVVPGGSVPPAGVVPPDSGAPETGAPETGAPAGDAPPSS